MCICTYVYWCMCIYAHGYERQDNLILRNLGNAICLLQDRASLIHWLEFSTYSRLTGICLRCPPVSLRDPPVWDPPVWSFLALILQVFITTLVFFIWVLGIEHRSSFFQGYAFTGWTIVLAKPFEWMAISIYLHLYFFTFFIHVNFIYISYISLSFGGYYWGIWKQIIFHYMSEITVWGTGMVTQ